MKRTEIKAREVVGYQHGSYGYLTPAAVIDTESLWTRTNGHSRTTWGKAAGWKCGRDRLYRQETGWLVVRVVAYGGADLDKGLKLLREWLTTVPEVIDADFVVQAANSMPEGLVLDIEANRDLHGPWEAAKSAADAAAESKREQWRREEAENNRLIRNISRINRALDEAKVPGMARRSSGDLVEIELSALAALLGVELEGES